MADEEFGHGKTRESFHRFKLGGLGRDIPLNHRPDAGDSLQVLGDRATSLRAGAVVCRWLVVQIDDKVPED